MTDVPHDSFEWWRRARFGMFIHWGLYSIAAGKWQGQTIDAISEWIMYFARIPFVEYSRQAKSFNPMEFDAKKWVSLAKDSGMKYIVMTSKHHDGFSMYHSKCSEYSIARATPFGLDPLAEMARECREQRMPFGVYYSQAQDWAEPDAMGNDWDFPEPAGKNFSHYFESKVKPQIKELLTEYGEINLIWFDTPMGMSEEQSLDLRNYVKSINPNCLINGRIGNGIGDYKTTGDNMIPSKTMTCDWEVPMTLNDSWGFREMDQNWKSPKELIRRLVNINHKGGNLLLNVGPDKNGSMPRQSIEILETIGNWMKVNGESIYDTIPIPDFPYELDWGDVTGKKGRIYLHIFHWGRGYDDIVGDLLIYGIRNKITKAFALADPDGKPLDIMQFPPTKSRNLHQAKVRLPHYRGPYDPIDSVICLEIDGMPEIDVIEEGTAI
jgi:alpha-L-fucosidase